MFSSPRSPNNSNHNNNNKRQLIRPSNNIPWSVDVVSAVPGPVAEILDTALSGATHKKWSCLAFPKGIFYVWQIQQTSNLEEGLQRPKEYLKLYLPDLVLSEEVDEQGRQKSPLVALSTPLGDDRDSVHLYALHPTSGWLVLRKISRRDMRSKIPIMTHTAKTRIQDIRNDNSDSDIDSDSDMATTEERSYFRSLTCYKSMVVVGTSKGDLYWITHIAVPVSLHVQHVKAQENSGFFTHFFYGSSANNNNNNLAGGTDLSSSDVVASNSTVVVPLSNDTKFLAVSKSLGVVRWTTELPIASGHHAIFTPTQLGNFNDTMTLSSSSEDDWKVQEVLRAVISIDNRFLHCIVRGTIVESGESRLYWIVARVNGISDIDEKKDATMTIVRSHWLSRFALPDQVRVLGLVSCENETVYAALSDANNSVIVMALVPGGEDDHIIKEVDLPRREVPNLLPNMMEQDMVTYGCYMVASSGIGMRARFTPQQLIGQSPSKRARIGNDGILGQHLRSHFWASYQDPTVDKPIPPSLHQAEPADLELAIIQIGAELQQKGDPSSYSISIEWHKSFVKLIKEGGLYRCLSEDGKWKLLGIGQELHVFGEMSQLLLHKYKHQDDADEWQAGLQSHSIADWLRSVQKSVERSRWLHSEIWYDILGTALSTILIFREDNARSVYDIASERCSEPLWISHLSLQELLNRQIKYWQTNHQDVPLELIELVVKTALLSYNESLSPSSSVEERMGFVQIQKSSISLLRLVSDGNDELAFDLCKQYRYFDGLCELSVAHEKKRDALSYALDPLFDTIEGNDSRSGWSFPQHVLQWHSDRELYGQVINYGRHSISDLNRIMDKNNQLRQYRWIPIIRQGYFGQATGMLLDNCGKEDNGLRSNQWALSMAKLTNKLVPAQSQQAQDQQRKIERQLELVDAQQMLLDDAQMQEKDQPMMQPDELIELVMKKLENSFDQEDRVRLAFVGLTVCNFIDDEKVAMEQTSRIWAECLLSDGAQWTEWASEGGGSDLAWLRENALSSTVFGRLLVECRKDEKNMNKVMYGRDIETSVLNRVQGDDNRESFTRVLRTVAAPDDSIQVESLMVSSF